jgi:hypothetical protein
MSEPPGLPCVALGDRALELGHPVAPLGLDALPGPLRVRRSGVGPGGLEHQDEVVVGALLKRQGDGQGLAAVPVGMGCGVLTPGPAHVGVLQFAGPRAVVALAELVQRAVAEVAARVEYDIDASRACERRDAAQDHRSIRVAGQCERFAAFDRRVAGHPAAVPDQAPRFVVAAPHIATLWRDRVGARAADQRREHRA